MKKSRFTESDIAGISKEADAGLPVGDVICKHGISTTTYYKWKAKSAGLDASEVKRIKELEAQLSEFKQIVDDPTLENKALKGLIDKNSDVSQEERSGRVSGWRKEFGGSKGL
jgi:putative transposase